AGDLLEEGEGVGNVLDDVDGDDSVEVEAVRDGFQGGAEDAHAAAGGRLGGAGGGLDAEALPGGAAVDEQGAGGAADIEDAGTGPVGGWGVGSDDPAVEVEAAAVGVGVEIPVVLGGRGVAGHEALVRDGRVLESEGAVGAAAEVEVEAGEVDGDAGD